MLFFLPARSEFLLYFRHFFLPLISFILLAFVCVIIFLLLNYRLFSLLEREDWPALSYYLENKIYTKGKYSARNVRFLAISYLVILDYASVFKLENKAIHAKPYVIEKNILIFGAVRILNGSLKEAVDFFRVHLKKGKKNERPWIRMFYGFSLLLCGAFNRAEHEFSYVAISSKNMLICGLSVYFLGASILNYSQKPDECKLIVENGRNRIIRKYKSVRGWEKEAEKVEEDIYAVIIKKYINEAGKWFFPPEQNNSKEGIV
jgi:hypothetical protein